MNRVTVSGGAYGFVTNRKRVIIAVVAFVISLHMIAASAQMFNDYPELTLSKPEFRHEASGAFIRLKCFTNPCHPTDIFRWEYKACGFDLHTTECHNSENIGWVPIPKNIKSKKCSSTHLIKNATGRYSGLYRCSKVIPESDQDVRVVKIFELCVIDRYPFMNGTKPVVLDVKPGNITTVPNSKIIMQCKVYSIIPPEIWWLRQIDITTTNVGFLIPNNNKRYVYLEASYQSFSGHTYISKLIIEKPTAKDTGIYACFAVNLFGSSDRDVLVTVTPPSEQCQGRTSFLLVEKHDEVCPTNWQPESKTIKHDPVGLK
ncbi:uncharacterized protein CBL_21041, partial [Carabus blaptoides fortunei]